MVFIGLTGALSGVAAAFPHHGLVQPAPDQAMGGMAQAYIALWNRTLDATCTELEFHCNERRSHIDHRNVYMHFSCTPGIQVQSG